MEIYNGSYCVYMHINKINGKMYVGQTISGNNPNRRWQNGHGYLVKNIDGNYKQPLIARAIQKYGWDNFEHEIIASNLTEQEAKNFEILMIDKLQLKNPKFGYNLTDGGEGTKGWTISETTREKFRARQKAKIGQLAPMYGKHHTQEAKDKMSQSRLNKQKPLQRISINQYTKGGEFINTFSYPLDAEKHTGISRSAIENCLIGLSKTAGGYIWKRSNEELTDEDILLVNSRKQINSVDGKKRKTSLQTEYWFDKRRGKYKVRFKKDGEYVCAKTYLTKEEAEIAIDNYKNNKESW